MRMSFESSNITVAFYARMIYRPNIRPITIVRPDIAEYAYVIVIYEPGSDAQCRLMVEWAFCSLYHLPAYSTSEIRNKRPGSIKGLVRLIYY